MGIRWYQGITVNFVRDDNGIMFVYENAHILEMETEDWGRETRCFVFV